MALMFLVAIFSYWFGALSGGIAGEAASPGPLIPGFIATFVFILICVLKVVFP